MKNMPLITKTQVVSPSNQALLNDQDALSAAKQRAATAVIAANLSIIRNQHMDRMHRAISNRKLKAILSSTHFKIFVLEKSLEVFREISSDMGKPIKAWSVDERRQAYDEVAAIYSAFGDTMNRPRGRPRKQGNSLLIGATSRRRTYRQKQKKEELKVLERRFIASIAGARLGAFSKKETKLFLRDGNSRDKTEMRLGTMADTARYVIENEVDHENMPQRLPRGFFQEWCWENGINTRDAAALRKRVSRMRTKFPDLMMVYYRRFAGIK